MQLHDIHPKHKPRKRKRVGRGGKRGTYSGRGIKGQKARAGRKFQPAIRIWIKKYPKLRGYKFKPKKPKPFQINLEVLEKKFNLGERVTPSILLEKRLIRKMKGRVPKVKILGEGKLTKALIIEGCLVSKKAKEEIKKAHGRIL